MWTNFIQQNFLSRRYMRSHNRNFILIWRNDRGHVNLKHFGSIIQSHQKKQGHNVSNLQTTHRPTNAKGFFSPPFWIKIQKIVHGDSYEVVNPFSFINISSESLGRNEKHCRCGLEDTLICITLYRLRLWCVFNKVQQPLMPISTSFIDKTIWPKVALSEKRLSLGSFFYPCNLKSFRR